MRRIVLLGGSGVFGSAIAEVLRAHGLEPHAPSHVEVDAEDGPSLLANLHQGDVVVDAAGPFHRRTTTLLELAVKVGFDVVDISDNLSYALNVRAMNELLKAAGVRVLSSCSAVSAVTAAAIRTSGVRTPVRVSVCLLPAGRDTTSVGTAASLLHSLIHPIREVRDGRLTDATGWSRTRDFRAALGRGKARGYLAESADAATLPPVWPSLRGVDFYVDTQVFGLNRVIAAGVRLPARARVLERSAPIGISLARWFGSEAGGYVVEVEADDRSVVTTALMAQRGSYMMAVIPAVLAARSLATRHVLPPGVVPPDRHCAPDELFGELTRLGIEIHRYS